MTKYLLEKIIKNSAPMLQPYLKFADAAAVLYALSVCESSGGTDRVPRFEKSYAPLGTNFTNEQPARYKAWGALAAQSYGSFQIMYCTACEQGFDSAPYLRSPLELQSDEVAIFYVIEFIKNRVVAKGGSRVEDIPDSYNTGNFKDQIFNQDYTKKFMANYNSLQKNADYITT